MKFKFETLLIWQKAMDLGEELNVLSEAFPTKEKFNLSSQICRAVDSIALNISEGSIGQSNAEFRKFMSYSIRSLAEVVTCLHKAQRRKYISDVEFEKYYSDSFNLMNMMIAFKKNIK
ncbi:four helix bundle protein [Reichenbachiella faecimaris]|uniref:Four helix bundle protein n=1 Tax=Reichenbachiella faecimaris TaxID=692418 RepID=A0A1W2GCR3_REIFA|nr:four helix bundle protein [Reichenbachiella faecimaris]SMD34314.1 four helix bundle protein [Reichenbachiella faecimaris]